MGLAIIIRHTAGAITTLVGLVFVLPAVSNALPENWQHNLARYFPANAGGAITSVIHDPTTRSVRGRVRRCSWSGWRGDSASAGISCGTATCSKPSRQVSQRRCSVRAHPARPPAVAGVQLAGRAVLDDRAGVVGPAVQAQAVPGGRRELVRAVVAVAGVFAVVVAGLADPQLVQLDLHRLGRPDRSRGRDR